MARLTQEQWASARNEYALGQLSRADIAREFGISRKALRNHMEKEGIEYGSASSSVRVKVQAKLIDNPNREPKVPGKVPGAGLPSDAVDMAAERGADIVWSHRKDIQALRELEAQFLTELGNDPTKLHVFHHQGVPVEHETGIAVTERITALRNLTAARAQRIALERQAYSLDEEQKDNREPLKEVRMVIVDE